ncbi:MAG: hypothetical protein ACR2KC_03105 [Acidimicrobiales bacterium]
MTTGDPGEWAAAHETKPAIPIAGQLAAGTTGRPIDFTAILADMQDQIDDLTSLVEAHQRRLDELDGGDPDAAKPEPS